MEIYCFQQIYKTLGFGRGKCKIFIAKLKDFFTKLENFSPKLKIPEIPVSVVAGKSVKK